MPTERRTLEDGIELIEGLLRSYGFERYPSDDDGVSSGGSFATCEFRRDDLEFGLIVRHQTKLGCPNYSEGKGYAGHQDMIRHLGKAGSERLVAGEFLSFEDRLGGNPFQALKYDLQEILLPTLQQAEAEFRAAIRKAHGERMRSLGAKGNKS